MAGDIRAQQEARDVPASLDADGAASVLVAVADGLQLQWLLDPDGVDMGARMTQVWESLKAGV